MKKIPLTQGKVALVDDCYYPMLMTLEPWQYDKQGNVAINSRTKQRLPRVIAQLSDKNPCSRILCKDGNNLNNQLENLLITFEDRFWSRVDKQDKNKCWNWLGRKTQGYGHITHNSIETLSHRLVYQFCKGSIPNDMVVLHTCDNPSCCNPEHLWLGTWADNNKDRAVKGRSANVKGEYSHTAKLTNKQVKYILTSKETCTKLAILFNVSISLISKIRTRKLWAHINV